MKKKESFISLLPEMTAAGVIGSETEQRIRQYIRAKYRSKGISWTFLVLGLIGALLNGAGVILLIAHNWDNLGRGARTVLSFLPLIAGQAVCVFTLKSRHEKRYWEEPSAIILSLSVAASIALIGQTYHIHGDLGRFLLTWMLLCVPLIYIMNSTAVALIYTAGILSWAGYIRNENQFFQILLLVLSVPGFAWFAVKFRENRFSVDSLIMNWAAAIWLFPAVMICYGDHVRGMWTVLVTAVFSVVYLSGAILYGDKLPAKANGMKTVGHFGLMITSFILTFRTNWEYCGWDEHIRDYYRGYVSVQADIVILGLLLAAVAVMAAKHFSRKIDSESILAFAPAVAGVCFLISGFGDGYVPQVIIANLAFLGAGAYRLKHGIAQGRLSIVNSGMIMIMALILARFFDTDLSFIMRGIAFIIMGVIFLSVNMWIAKKGTRS